MKRVEQSKAVFSWREGQAFQLLIDGVEFFPEMLQTIEAAKSHVLIEMYIMESGQVADQFIDAMLRAVTRGVTVCVLLDGYGSRGLLMKDRKTLEDGGVHTAIFNPLRFDLFTKKLVNNLFRTHRKFMVVDGCIAYVGGTGISDDFLGETAWRDCMLRVRGTIAEDWQALFDRDWARWSDFGDIPQVIATAANGSSSGQVVCTRGGIHLQLKKNLLNRIRRGQQRIWLASAYFIPSGKIRRALRRAARQGKDVRLLLPGSVTDHPAIRQASRRYYARLLAQGVRIFEYQNRFMHTKIVLVDDWCTIGSSNMDRWNFRWNLEANQEVKDAELAKDVKEMLLNDFAHSIEIQHKSWLQRSRLQRLREWLWGKVDRWLTR